MATYLKRHGDYWYYQRRVPKHLAHLDRRGLIRKSTKTRYKDRAIPIAHEINRQTELYWEALADGRPVEGELTYNDAVRQARILGINYKTINELAEGKLDEILDRLSLLESQKLIQEKPAAEVVLGSVDRPSITLNELPELFFQQAADILSRKTPLQARKWKNPRLKAIKNLIALIGNKKLEDLTRHDALIFRNWWMDRLQNENMDVGSANKDIGAINQMINDINDKFQLGLNEPFARMRLRGEKHTPRPPFPPEWVRDRLLREGALRGLNIVCQTVIVVMAFTGMRPSEIVGLTDEDILLDHDYPHVKVRANIRSLKTEHSARDLPLIGRALRAVKELMPQGGFASYYGRADQLTSNINRYLQNAELLPSNAHSLYSLRHTFQDRLIEVECPDRIQAELMGHKFARPKYGKGPSLKQKAYWLEKVGY